MITAPKVTLVAVTTLVQNETTDEDIEDALAHGGRLPVSGGLFDILPPQEDVEEVYSGDYLAEFAGRACYQSWNRPNPRTASTEDYIANILETEHYSVLSHGSASFYIEGVSRALSLELIRSRFLAFSQVSQRYVSSSDLDWVCPPILLDDPAAQEVLENTFIEAVAAYEWLAERTEERGKQLSPTGTMVRKRAREAARAVLPNDTETKLVVSGNYRAWRDFIAQRWTVHADLEIQRLAGVLLGRLQEIAPATFADFDATAPAS